MVIEGCVQGSTVTLAGNRADGVQSMGYAAQAGGGLLFSASQPEQRIRLATDGVRPFAVSTQP